MADQDPSPPSPPRNHESSNPPQRSTPSFSGVNAWHPSSAAASTSLRRYAVFTSAGQAPQEPPSLIQPSPRPDVEQQRTSLRHQQPPMAAAYRNPLSFFVIQPLLGQDPVPLRGREPITLRAISSVDGSEWFVHLVNYRIGYYLPGVQGQNPNHIYLPPAVNPRPVSGRNVRPSYSSVVQNGPSPQLNANARQQQPSPAAASLNPISSSARQPHLERNMRSPSSSSGFNYLLFSPESCPIPNLVLAAGRGMRPIFVDTENGNVGHSSVSNMGLSSSPSNVRSDVRNVSSVQQQGSLISNQRTVSFIPSTSNQTNNDNENVNESPSFEDT